MTSLSGDTAQSSVEDGSADCEVPLGGEAHGEEDGPGHHNVLQWVPQPREHVGVHHRVPGEQLHQRVVPTVNSEAIGTQRMAFILQKAATTAFRKYRYQNVFSVPDAGDHDPDVQDGEHHQQGVEVGPHLRLPAGRRKLLQHQ